MFFFANTWMDSDPRRKRDMYNCAMFYSSPIFFLTFLIAVLFCISLYSLLQYTMKAATILNVDILVYPLSTSSRPFFSSAPPAPHDIRYRYDIQYEHNGKTYIKVIEQAQARKMGDTVDIRIHKRHPDQLRSSSFGMDDLFLPLLLLLIYFVFHSTMLALMLLTNLGRIYICTKGIFGSIFGGGSSNDTMFSSSSSSSFLF